MPRKIWNVLEKSEITDVSNVILGQSGVRHGSSFSRKKNVEIYDEIVVQPIRKLDVLLSR